MVPPLQATAPLVKALCAIVTVTTHVYCGLSSCLGFKQMGLGSIHNSFDLGKVITTEGNSATAKHQDPKQLWSWHRWMRIFFTGDLVQVCPQDVMGGGCRQGSPSWEGH